MTPPPKYLYKILPSDPAPPSPLPAALPLSALDSKDGFIHLSTSIQTAGTAVRFFADQDILVLAKIAYADVVGDIKWEEAGHGGLFAHLYNGGRLGKDEIEEVRTWTKEKAESWDAVLAKDATDWLEY